MKKMTTILALMLSATAYTAPTLQMNRAFNSITNLVPFITEREKFLDKKNEKMIAENIKNIKSAFSDSKHESILKTDLFAPSYKMIKENIAQVEGAFAKGKKDYAHFLLKGTTGQCLDCHTRLPVEHASSFQTGELQIQESKFKSSYNLGLAYMIVRNYALAEMVFTKVIDESLVKKQFNDLELAMKQILVIETKVLRNPEKMIKLLKFYQGKKNFPESLKGKLSIWISQLDKWKKNLHSGSSFSTDKEIEQFVNKNVKPLFDKEIYAGDYDVEMMFLSGTLSKYLFEHSQSAFAPNLVYWIGKTELYLKRDNFFSSGDMFLKECIERYPKSSVAKECFGAYSESVEFEYSGSSGTHIPVEIKDELARLKSLISR